MGDRVLVMSPLPGTIKREVDIKGIFPNPRTMNIRKNTNFVEIVENLREYLEG